MNKASLTVGLLVITSVLLVTLTILPGDVRAAAHYVGGGGPGNYTTIQEAIDAADPGDTVYVYNGTYYENLEVYKTLSLIGENRNTTIVDGGGSGDVVLVTADWVSLTGFTMTNSGGPGGNAGIVLDSVEKCYIANNNVSDNWNGILLSGSNSNTVTENIASYNLNGIYLAFSSNNTITGNVMVWNGIAVWGDALEHWNTHVVDASNIVNGKPVRYWKNAIGGAIPSGAGQVILANCTDVRVENQNASDGSIGIQLGFSSNNTIIDNDASWNYRYGIFLSSSSNNTIDGNNASSNEGKGIYLYFSDGNAIISNNASENWEYGIYLDSSSNNTFSNNSALSNDYGMDLRFSNHNNIQANNFSSNRYGINLYRSTNNTIVGNNASSSEDDGIHIYSSSNDNIISENVASWNDLYGIRISFSTNNVITNNTISSNRRGIYIDTSGNSTIADNSATYNQDQGIRLRVSDDAIITGNNLSNNEMGIEFYACAHANLTGNRISSNSWFGIHIQSSTEIRIAGNNVSDNDWGIWLESSTSITFTGNTFANDGILLAGNDPVHFDSHSITTDNLVYNLPIYYYKNCIDVMIDAVSLGQLLVVNCANVTVSNVSIAGTDAGIEMAFVDDAIITGSNLSSNEKMGVYVYYSVNVTVTESDFSHNGVGVRLIGSNVTITNNSVSSNKYGIQINSYDVSVVGNNISSNVGGIRVDNSSALTIADNNVSSNINFGIRLLGSTGILVHHNNIVDNTVQAVDGAGNENSWDNGYPSGGNYWSDYTGVDDCSGPNQDNCPDPDGIGDTPYVIDADSQDRYPLMSPIGTISPQPPRVQQATLSGNNLENVTLTWSLSPDDGMGLKSVTGYEIRRGTTHDSRGTGYGLIASLPNGTSTFIDTYAGEGDPSNYFYQVCAIDLHGNITCDHSHAGKFTRSLSVGLNLVSFPLSQSNESIATLLQTVGFDKAWTYDSSSCEWKSYMKLKPYSGDLEAINHAMGVWLNVTEGSNLTIAGTVPAQTTIHLYEGWNLVSFPSFNATYTVSDMKADVGATRVEGYDGSAYPYHLRVLEDEEVLQAGYAYWVRVEADTVWVVGAI